MEEDVTRDIRELCKLDQIAFAMRLEQLRKARGLTQAQLAAAARMSLSQYRRAINGHNVGSEKLFSLSRAMNLPPDQVIKQQSTISMVELWIEQKYMSKDFMEQISDSNEVLFAWDLPSGTEESTNIIMLCQHPDIVSLYTFVLKSLKEWEGTIHKSETSIAAECYKFNPEDKKQSKYIGVVKCKIADYLKQESIARRCSELPGIVESRALLGKDDLMLVWRGDSEDYFDSIVEQINHMDSVQVTIQNRKTIGRKARYKFSLRKLDNKDYIYTGLLKRGNAWSNVLRIRVMGYDGFPLPWDLVIRGLSYQELIGSRISIALYTDQQIPKGRAENVPRDEPWD